ncbi:Orexin receptor type 2 [Orchesella cincta]|uniref:Orexin receptor type 2 n=1 Tax=Orchesella cincta TaxID=48709 RepID=A0A1D2MNB0_ORCCI|nr:Orexin receptor type 2 [Orchesella cincta]
METVSVSVSVLTLTVISIERWYAICYPLKFKATTSRAKRLILLIWVISLVVDIPELIGMETQPTVPANTIYLTTCTPNWSMEVDIMYVILRTLILYAVPLMFMSFAYYQIVRVLWSTASIPGGRREVPVVNGNGVSHENGQCSAQCK